MHRIQELTVGDVLEYVAPGLWKSNALLRWPPDAFAAAAMLLHRSGGYANVLRGWPPKPASTWAQNARRDGALWRKFAAKSVWEATRDLHERPGGDVADTESLLRHLLAQPVPNKPWYHELARHWKTITKQAKTNLGLAMKNRSFRHATLQICALADEACLGIGRPQTETQTTQRSINWAFYNLVLSRQSSKKWIDLEGRRRAQTACVSVSPSRAITLPKLHTPQLGLTLRALTHHIALCPGTEVRPDWLDWTICPAEFSLNVLVVPWPRTVRPAQFRACSPQEIPFELPESFGHFTYDAGRPDGDLRELKRILRAALAAGGGVDAVILPELALPSIKEYNQLVRVVLQTLQPQAAKNYKLRAAAQRKTSARSVVTSPPVFIIAGVNGKSRGKRQPKENLAMCTIAYWIKDAWYGQDSSQAKQHSWKLNASQIRTYNLGWKLDTSKDWWEHNRLGERTVRFISLADWLTMCVVICEDLARQDPLVELLRAVGPTLVVALLMDAPQLPHRWPGRYATVLADDPGSSVLTVTSIGMAKLSTPPQGVPPSRSIALWKDTTGEPIKIELPDNAGAMLLTMSRKEIKEWTIDGRCNHDDSTPRSFRKYTLLLDGALPIF